MSRRTTMKRAALPALAIASALLLAGCSGGGDAKQSEPEEGPLAKYMAPLYDGEEYTQEKMDADNKKIEDLVAKCMTKEGFEYTPNLQNGGTVFSSEEEEDGPEWGSVEFAEKYGYGFIDSPGMEEMPDEGEMEEMVDPNQEYIESLSESEAEAYNETLYGPQPTEEEWAEMEESGNYDYEQSGCYADAQKAVQGKSMQAYEDPEFADLFAAQQEFYTDIYGDGSDMNAVSPNDDIAKLDRQWADCMADAGFDGFTSPNSASNVISEEYNALQMPDGEDGEWVELSKEDQKKFQKREIEVAVADATCKKQLKYEDAVMKITFALEQKFVDEHKSELDALLAKYATDKKKG